MRCLEITLLVVLVGPSQSPLPKTQRPRCAAPVTDPSSALVPGAEVTLENKASGFEASRSTESNGEFTFVQIPPGRYTIMVRSKGFAAQTKAAELLVNQSATINFALSMEVSSTTVEVSSAAQFLNTTDATIGNAVNNAIIQALPMEGRNVTDLLSLQPGVVYLGHEIDQDFDSRSGAVSGARSDQGNITLDGVDNNYQRGYAFYGVLRSTLDSVESFGTLTSPQNLYTVDNAPRFTALTDVPQFVPCTAAGEVGNGNNFRGDGYFGVDAALSKSWKIHEGQSLKFAWEVFNVTNSVRFDTNRNTSLQNLSTSGSLGVYAAALTAARVQQFSLRLEF